MARWLHPFKCPECGKETLVPVGEETPTTCTHCGARIEPVTPIERRVLEFSEGEAKRRFVILRRLFRLYKEGKYSDSELLHFLAGWCHFAPRGEEAKLLESLR